MFPPENGISLTIIAARRQGGKFRIPGLRSRKGGHVPGLRSRRGDSMFRDCAACKVPGCDIIET